MASINFGIHLLVGWIIFVVGMCWVLYPKNRRCPKCGFQSAFSKYCHRDGSKMVRAKRIFLRCTKCHREVWRSDGYCGHCGDPVPKGV
jgi:uncharacterized protein with PIN domain